MNIEDVDKSATETIESKLSRKGSEDKVNVEGLWKDELSPLRSEYPCEQTRRIGGCSQSGVFELI